MDTETKENEISALELKISAANRAYRDGHPTMSDQVFDDLCDKYRNLVSVEAYSLFRDTLHEVAGKVKHPFIMGSLNKLKAEEPEEVLKFIKEHISTTLNISAKVDGISSRAHYEDGRLMSLTSRGDGYFGEDFTPKMAFIKGLPKQISLGGSVDVRGELVIRNEDFASMSGYANARNACAGIMNRKDWAEKDVSKISFVAYTILGTTFDKAKQFTELEENKFNVAWHFDYTSAWYNSLDFIKTLVKDASQDFGYDTDGLVLCDSAYRNEDKYRPDACEAFKINQQVATTRLLDVEWSGPSKDGFFVGVGIIDPVTLGGATIERVTLHNLDFIVKHNLMYGSVVKVLRSGDVIPKLVEVVENDSHCRPIEIPNVCPACGAVLVRDGINMRCVNHDCADQVIHRLVSFIKKLGVKSASNATLANFGITSFERLMLFIPDRSYKSQVKLYDELYAKVFSQSKEKLLCAMNFVGLSEILVGKIINHYGIAAVMEPGFTGKDTNTLPNGIGEITLSAFVKSLPEAQKHVNMVVNDQRWHYTETAIEHANMISEKGTICVTGSLKFGSRSKFLEFAKEHGYESKSGVSKGLTYLVNNDINSNSSKNKKAKELGIKILSEDEFMKIAINDKVDDSLFAL